MPLDVRKISINIAVICFFGLSIIMLVSGLPPYTCCKRAIIGAFLVYIAAGIAVRLINMILIDAMISKQMEKDENPKTANKVKTQG